MFVQMNYFCRIFLLILLGLCLDLLIYCIVHLIILQQLRGKRRENQTVDLVKQDYEVTVKLENEPIQRSKSVDSAVLGKYSLWRKQNENENSDSNVRTIQDQMIMARVYISLAITKNKLDLAHELQNRLRDSQRSLGEGTTDSHLHRR